MVCCLLVFFSLTLYLNELNFVLRHFGIGFHQKIDMIFKNRHEVMKFSGPIPLYSKKSFFK